MRKIGLRSVGTVAALGIVNATVSGNRSFIRTALLGTLVLLGAPLATGVARADGAPVPFSCTGEAYSVRGNPTQAQLFLIDQTVTPFEFTAIGPPATGPFEAGGGVIPIQLNNLGYRVTDNLLYAVAMPLSGNYNYGIVQIDSTGAVTPFLPANTDNWPSNVRLLAGDVSTDGSTMYVNTYPNSDLYIVDLEAKRVTVQNITGGSFNVADWAVNPEDGNLYGGDASGTGLANIYRLTPGGVLTDLGPVQGLYRSNTTNGRYFGGSWFTADGTLVLYRNSDYIYEVDLSNSPPTLVDSFEGGGVNSTLNDAAACASTTVEKEQIAGVEEVGIYEESATEITFEITYNGPPTLIVDKVPAEFEVTGCTPTVFSCYYYLDADAKGPQAQANSATIIEWAIGAAGTYTLTVDVATRESSGNKRSTVYKPTSCGDLSLNDGATAYQVDESGNPVLDENFNMIPLVTSNVLVVEAVAGTKPCAPDGLTVTFVPTDTLSLDWDANTETVHHYNVYRGSSEDGPFAVIAMPEESEYEDSGLVQGYYCYQVKAAFGPGDEAEGNEGETVCETVVEPST